MFKTNLLKITYLCLMITLVGCSGVQTFQSSLRAGDTAAVAAGWKHDFSRDNITVIITPSIGAPITYLPNDPAVRGVVNMYPDPISSLLISEATEQDLTPYAQAYAQSLSFFTDGDRDMWQTTVFIDLPASLPIGLANIEISNVAGDTVISSINIIEGQGNAEDFIVDINGPLSKNQFSALERVEHFEVSFSSAVIPYAIQANLSHAPDVNTGGVGVAHVSNPRGDLKGILWKDNGSDLQVLLTPSKFQPLARMIDFKFYVSGGVSDLAMVDVVAVDINGNPVTGVIADIVSGK